MPENMDIKSLFYWIEIGLGAVFLGLLLRGRSKEQESQFRTREADILSHSKSKSKPNSPEQLAQSRIQREKPLLLKGISIHAPANEILGISIHATSDEIQKAYREKMKQYHPDRVARPGTPQWQEAQKIAEAINRAKNEMLKIVRN